MAKKTSRGLVALSASAVAAIYVAGYLTTQGADARLTAGAAAEAVAAATIAATQPPAAPTAATAATATASAVQPPARSAPSRGIAGSVAVQPAPTATPAPATSSTTSVAYRDGTYTGQGTSRHGGVDVSVTVQGGRITDVTMTRVWTQYPATRIAGLPAQVVARQSVQVDRISGATSSVQAFQGAVQQALAKARA